ncbi:hypothetical protein HanRHA438_Chr11g0509841 [Helianthus annuus]|uniref:Uncharacterized protein n=1 Tax=Helianthus annuus TaxID=4232 RepID=A0A251T9G9_HELAN|nr:hypothetical protein HanXRQr2_Chr11g0497251 [Helianthus annuus]KAJ0871235.1 hypothetical protein HanRHA438_Chr11g0509841 [Helianthus annuus]KAJ0875685.1 hypothetical protein HanPSC8_Chr11g0479281 [Helianthus annuus]
MGRRGWVISWLGGERLWVICNPISGVFVVENRFNRFFGIHPILGILLNMF